MKTAVRSSLLDRPLFSAPAQNEVSWTRQCSATLLWRLLIHYSTSCYLKYRRQTTGKMTDPVNLHRKGKIVACWFLRRHRWGKILGNIPNVLLLETGWDSDVYRPSGMESNVVWYLRYSFDFKRIEKCLDKDSKRLKLTRIQVVTNHHPVVGVLDVGVASGSTSSTSGGIGDKWRSGSSNPRERNQRLRFEDLWRSWMK